jgi:hypothetical protein
MKSRRGNFGVLIASVVPAGLGVESTTLAARSTIVLVESMIYDLAPEIVDLTRTRGTLTAGFSWGNITKAAKRPDCSGS